MMWALIKKLHKIFHNRRCIVVADYSCKETIMDKINCASQMLGDRLEDVQVIEEDVGGRFFMMEWVEETSKLKSRLDGEKTRALSCS